MDMLFIKLEKNQSVPLYEQIYDQIRRDITNGKLPIGMKLPSKRKLGDFLNISQTTIEFAYAQLVAEGFISSKPRKGYYVQAIEELAYVQPVELTAKSILRKKKICPSIFHLGKLIQNHFHSHNGGSMPKTLSTNPHRTCCCSAIRMGTASCDKKLPAICTILVALIVRLSKSSSALEQNNLCHSLSGFSVNTQPMRLRTLAIHLRIMSFSQ